MGKNKKENFIFTMMSCSMMVLGMMSFNIWLNTGFSKELWLGIVEGFLPGFLLALVLDWFLVGRMAKALVAKIVKPEDPMIKRVMLISFFMVSGMCLSMSFLTSWIHLGFSKDYPMQFLIIWLRNFPLALLLQFLIVGPIAR
ncbi:MAG: DUF2798 domain-containing protein, partial [Vallitaleaceae bacterium]|nr:DUF2798 domain-containing protein [Vallitaleaceae bacterium]